jgi:hypothetical protein
MVTKEGIKAAGTLLEKAGFKEQEKYEQTKNAWINTNFPMPVKRYRIVL